MSSIFYSGRRRRRLVVGVKQGLREVRAQLAQLNHEVSGRAGLKDVDLDCLDLINAHGPLGPSALARRAGLHPATVTGILDRLQRGGWITRERDPEASDRRAVVVRASPERNAELFRLYSGMSAAMDEICADYDERELQLIVDFLHRTATASRTATEDLAGGRGV
ncbi:MarR family winged helix-turn-helix transcriptional regulator [Saccharopolyspora griseoalba]|uniref:MarR family winged helix-turn-helix transcriptional regulator n=1 Tax=Saccharopolyspora griseoalba TaxID=1431848 RepID=A0ABW2LK26_9PSEU